MAEIPDRPLLKPWYRIAEGEGALVLEYAHRAVTLSGRALERLVPALLPLLDGERTLDEIVDELGPATAEAVTAALTLLAENGLLARGPSADDETSDFLAAAGGGGLSPATVRANLGGRRIAVAGSSAAGERAARLLRDAGVRVERAGLADPPASVDACLVAPCGDELPALAPWNQRALRASTPWLQVLPFDGRIAAIGPLVVPGESACGECYAIRRRSCLGYPDEQPALDAAPAYRPSAPPLDAAAAGIATVVLLRWLVGDRSIAGRLLALALAPLPSLTTHVVYRVPRCPACSPADVVAPLLPWFKVAA